MTAADTTPMESTSVVVTERGTEAKKNAVVFSPELLAMYYSRLFPFHLMFDWLSYDPTGTCSEKLFARREFSFTIDVGGEEIYIRYQSYTKQADFQAAILQRKPMKIDIGAVFSHPPKDHKAIAHGFQTEQRELVFDIDLTDYDEVRHCGCAGASICTKCWQMMTMAVKVMEKGLREDFGFKHIAWFYSGRRGVHAWVCDETARTLSNEARSAVASYFEVRIAPVKNAIQILLSSPLSILSFRSIWALTRIRISLCHSHCTQRCNVPLQY
jgi:DNA primase small subunit